MDAAWRHGAPAAELTSHTPIRPWGRPMREAGRRISVPTDDRARYECCCQPPANEDLRMGRGDVKQPRAYPAWLVENLRKFLSQPRHIRGQLPQPYGASSVSQVSPHARGPRQPSGTGVLRAMDQHTRCIAAFSVKTGVVIGRDPVRRSPSQIKERQTNKNAAGAAFQ